MDEVNRYALYTGINEFHGKDGSDKGSDLRGCRHDAEDDRRFMAAVGWRPRAEVSLFDREATASRELEELERLVDLSEPPAHVLWTHSSHGTRVPNATDSTLLDEVMCCADVHWYGDDFARGCIRDKQIARIIAKLRKGVKLFVKADLCHAGDLTRAFTIFGHRSYYVPRYLPNPHLGELGRMPAKQFGLQAIFDFFGLGEEETGRPASTTVPLNIPASYQVGPGEVVHEDMSDVVLWAACDRRQTAADAFIGGTHQGAFSWGWKKALWTLLGHEDRAPVRPTLSDHHRALRALLKGQDFDQDPQLETSLGNMTSTIFP